MIFIYPLSILGKFYKVNSSIQTNNPYSLLIFLFFGQSYTQKTN